MPYSKNFSAPCLTLLAAMGAALVLVAPVASSYSDLHSDVSSDIQRRLQSNAIDLSIAHHADLGAIPPSAYAFEPAPFPQLAHGSRRYRSSRSSHHHYYYGHTHHAHCGHGYWGYGDAFESRTLGRSCIYGPKGEVIYKPADVICAPDESAAPATTKPKPKPGTAPPSSRPPQFEGRRAPTQIRPEIFREPAH